MCREKEAVTLKLCTQLGGVSFFLVALNAKEADFFVYQARRTYREKRWRDYMETKIQSARANNNERAVFIFLLYLRQIIIRTRRIGSLECAKMSNFLCPCLSFTVRPCSPCLRGLLAVIVTVGTLAKIDPFPLFFVL